MLVKIARLCVWKHSLHRYFATSGRNAAPPVVRLEDDQQKGEDDDDADDDDGDHRPGACGETIKALTRCVHLYVTLQASHPLCSVFILRGLVGARRQDPNTRSLAHAGA